MGIFWIASYPKSGNTWIRAFLANVMSQSRPVSLNKLGDYCNSEPSARWYEDFGDVQSMDARPSKDNMSLRQLVQERLSLNASPRDILLKTHNQNCNCFGLPLIRKDLTVGAIYVVRDPRDVVVSLSDHSGISIDDAINLLAKDKAYLGPNGAMRGRQMFEFVGSWSKHVNSWTDNWHPRVMILRYEDCLEDPENTLGNLPQWMGITQDIWRIKAAIAASDFRTLKSMEEKEGFKEKSEHTDTFFSRGKAGSWKELLTNAQANKIKRHHSETMRRFGYN